jgi:pentose-5-phosphate-3-epimerase
MYATRQEAEKVDEIISEVKGDVTRLLAMVANDGTNPEAFEFVVDRLTQMVIMSVAPPGCRSSARIESSVSSMPSDFSEAKESFIAP